MRAMLLNSRPLIYFLVVAVFSLSLPHRPAEAHLVTTEATIAASPDAETNRARVRAFLDRQDVQAQLEAYGINVDEARARVDSLTDDEVAQIADKLDQLPAGAGGEGLGILVVVAVYAVVGSSWGSDISSRGHSRCYLVRPKRGPTNPPPGHLTHWTPRPGTAKFLTRGSNYANDSAPCEATQVWEVDLQEVVQCV